MLTGRHMVRDVMCKNCNSKLGWMYEYATDNTQKYKEGRVILEYALITESEGIQADNTVSHQKSMQYKICKTQGITIVMALQNHY